MAFRDRPLPVDIGRYHVVRLQGQGAMGRVLLAHDSVLDRDVALKLLRDDLSLALDQRESLTERMRQEARAAARVSHPNIVTLHDMGEDPDFGLYLVFEYLEGATLKERLERGSLGPIASARLATEIGGALMTAHEAGVLHRDIKPENIILTPTGAKVADFGIARVPDSTLTQAGGLLGTPAYSAPEAASGGRFSPKSDQFSMAATLYEAISGRRAFPGEDAVAVASQIATVDPAPIASTSGVDPHVDTVLARALSRDPRQRFDSCDELGSALSEALRMAPRSAMPTLPDEVHRAAQEATGVRVARAATGGIAVGAMLAIVGFQLTARLRPEEPKREASEKATTKAVVKPIEEAAPIAWLDDKPRALPKERRPHASDHPRAGHRDELSESASSEQPDAGARTKPPDAGAPP